MPPSCVGQALTQRLSCMGQWYDGTEEPALWPLPGFCFLGEWADSGKWESPARASALPCIPGDQETA